MKPGILPSFYFAIFAIVTPWTHAHAGVYGVDNLQRYATESAYLNNLGTPVADSQGKAYLTDYAVMQRTVMAEGAEGETVKWVWSGPADESVFEAVYTIVGQDGDGNDIGCWYVLQLPQCAMPYLSNVTTGRMVSPAMTEEHLGPWTVEILHNDHPVWAEPFMLVTPSLSRTDGDNQVGQVLQQLPTPLEVRLLNDDGEPIPNRFVSFQIYDTPRIRNQDTPPDLASSAVTDEFGYAGATLTLGSVTGEYKVVALSGDAPTDVILFTAVAIGELDGEISDDKENGEPDCEETVSNPINLTTGNNYLGEIDIAPNVPSLLEFSRVYNSRDDSVGMLGAGWRHTYDRSISTETVGKGNNTTTIAHLRRPDGKRLAFREDGVDWIPDGDVHAVLSSGSGGWTYVADNITEAYDTSGRLVSITWLNGRSVQLSYNGAGRLQTVTGDIGSEIGFSYNGQGRISAMVDGAQRTWQYSYDADANLVQVTRPDQMIRIYHYEDSRHPNALTGVTDERGIRYASYEYDNELRAVSSYHAGDAGRVDVVYHQNDTRTVTNSMGQVSTYYVTGRFGSGLVTRIEGPGCSTCAEGDSEFLYDNANNLVERNIRGLRTIYGGYDGGNAPRYIMSGAGTGDAHLTMIYYDERFDNLETEIHEPSVSGGYMFTEKEYDDFGNTIRLSMSGFSPDGSPLPDRTTFYAYGGPAGQLSAIDGPRTDAADVFSLEYYPNDPAQGSNRARLQRVTGPQGLVLRDDIQYTATGKVASELRPNGITISYSYYPGNDRLETMTESDGAVWRVTRWTWLPTGEIESATVGYGSSDATTVSFGYDDARRLVSIHDGAGNYRSFTLDTEGNVVAEGAHDPSGILKAAVTRVFDAHNRVQSQGQANETRTFGYGPDGTLAQETDGNANANYYGYDGLRRLATITHGSLSGNDHLRLGYDQRGNLISIGSFMTPVLFEYDDLGNLLSSALAETGMTSFGHDAAGNVISRQNSLGRLFQYQYDAWNRLIVLDAPGVEDDLDYSYDYCLNGQGRLCAITTGAGISVNYAYDGLGNVTAHQGVNYGYDQAGRPQSMTYPSGALVTWQYDQAGRIQGINLSGSPLATGVTYHPFGPVAGFTYGNGLTNQRQVDAAYRPALERSGTVLERSHDQYDGNGNLLQVTETANGSQLVSEYGYHWDNSLDVASGDFGDRDYGYDWTPAALRKSHHDGNETYPYQHGPGMWLRWVGEPTYFSTGGELGVGWRVGTDQYLEFSHDAAGNRTDLTRTAHECEWGTYIWRGFEHEGDVCTLVTEDQWAYSYTAHSQMKSAALETLAGPQGETTYVYNALGQRVRKTLPDGTVTRYVYGLDGALLAELDSQGVPLKEYIYFNGGLLAVRDLSGGAPVLYYVHNDHLGAPRAMTSTAGQVVWRASYDPFGMATVDEDANNTGVTVTLNVRFPGQYHDAETGLHYNYFRYYDPETGQYTTSDPIGVAGGLNTYAYALGNPIRYVDPLGLDVSICYYPGLPSHVGLGVNTTNTIGRRTDGTSSALDILFGNKVPGQVSPDSGVKQCVMIKTTSEEDQRMQDYIDQNIEFPGSYNLYSRSCVDFVRDGLKSVLGLDLGNTMLPRTFFNEIRSHAGAAQ